MDKEKLIKELEDQIVVCDQTIQQNLGVIQFCRGKIEQLKKAEDPKPEETQK